MTRMELALSYPLPPNGTHHSFTTILPEGLDKEEVQVYTLGFKAGIEAVLTEVTGIAYTNVRIETMTDIPDTKTDEEFPFPEEGE